jgi:hypothetical protein
MHRFITRPRAVLAIGCGMRSTRHRSGTLREAQVAQRPSKEGFEQVPEVGPSNGQASVLRNLGTAVRSQAW